MMADEDEEFHGDGISVGGNNEPDHDSEIYKNLHQTEAPKKLEQVTTYSEQSDAEDSNDREMIDQINSERIKALREQIRALER